MSDREELALDEDVAFCRAPLTEDGEPLDAARGIYEVIRLLNDHKIGNGTPSPTYGARVPRDSALETKKNTVLRV